MRIVLRLILLSVSSVLGLVTAAVVAVGLRTPAAKTLLMPPLKPAVAVSESPRVRPERPQSSAAQWSDLRQPSELDPHPAHDDLALRAPQMMTAIPAPRIAQRYRALPEPPEPTQLAAGPTAMPGLDLSDPATQGAVRTLLKNPQVMQGVQGMLQGQPGANGQNPPATGSPEMLNNLNNLLQQLGQQPGGAPAAGAPPASTPPQMQLPPPSPAPADAAPAKPEKASEPAEAEEEKMHITPIPTKDGDHLSLNIHDEDLRRVLEGLSEFASLNILASASVQGKVSAVLTDVDIDGALDAILKSTGYLARRDGKFIYIGTPQDFATMEMTQDKIGTRIYRPNYIASRELQSLLTPLLTNGIGKISITSPAEVGIAQNTAGAGGDGIAEPEAILVQDYEAVLAEVDQVVKELDKRPLQVSIEAMILSVKLNDQNKFGVDFQALRNQSNIRLGSGTPSQAPLSGGIDPTNNNQVGALAFTTGGLKFAFLDSHLSAFITALETIGNTDVIATPRLLCLNKQRAEILIGFQFPYQNAILTSTSTSSQTLFQDYGTQLRLRPFISTDGSIRMEVHPEISSPGVQVGTGPPAKNVTQVTTNIMCRDGCTVIIGGLMQEELDNNLTQLPLIGSVPYIGWLFRSKNTTVVREEILVLITPRIVYDPEFNQESQDNKHDFQVRQQVVSDNMSLISRFYLSKQYVRKAKSALSVGDKRHAAKLAQLAIRMDPDNLEAITIREDLEEEVPPQAVLNGEAPPAARRRHSRGPGVHEGGPALAPAEGIAPWMLDELSGKAGPAPLPLHPRDPGVPGYSREIQLPEVFRNVHE
jgi:type IV pilus assembly protein PilQ